MPCRLSYEQVKQFFEDYKCILLEDQYINNFTKMKFRCHCGRESIITYRDFRITKRCQICGEEFRANNRKHSYEFIRQEFEKYGCELLDEKYIGNHSPLKFKCKCGSIDSIAYSDFMYVHQCKKCSIKKVADDKRLSYEYVKEQFEINKCKLLENEYINNHTPMRYICNCGNKAIITWNSFKNGSRCNKCEGKRTSRSLKENGNLIIRYGSEHPNWNPSLTREERENNRDILENKIWRKQVFERDDYTCQACGEYGGKLRAHHLDGYHWAVKERFDIENGITLCKKCHKNFHDLFGYKNNTKEQFFMFNNNQLIIR